jgi:hypothetical protein
MAPSTEDVEKWEKMMACCFPWGFVWYKRGMKKDCGINFALGCFLGCCCVNVCHACKYVGEAPDPGAPAAGNYVITSQPR